MISTAIASSDTHLQYPELFSAGCHSSVTVLMVNTIHIIEICTPRNLFLMVRVAYTLYTVKKVWVTLAIF